MFQATDSAGHEAHYRVKVDAKASLSKTSYAAGLFDATAVDALFGNASAVDQNSIDESLDRHRRAAVDTLAYDALAAGKDEAAARDALNKAITPIARQQKYAIVYSANASVVLQAIADFAADQDTTNTVLSLIAPFKRDEYLQAKVDSESLDRVSKMVGHPRVHRPLPGRAHLVLVHANHIVAASRAS